MPAIAAMRLLPDAHLPFLYDGGYGDGGYTYLELGPGYVGRYDGGEIHGYLSMDARSSWQELSEASTPAACCLVCGGDCLVSAPFTLTHQTLRPTPTTPRTRTQKHPPPRGPHIARHAAQHPHKLIERRLGSASIADEQWHIAVFKSNFVSVDGVGWLVGTGARGGVIAVLRDLVAPILFSYVHLSCDKRQLAQALDGILDLKILIPHVR